MAAIFCLAVFLAAPVHAAFAHEEHEEVANCPDGFPLTHFDDCVHDLDAHCTLCVHSVDNSVRLSTVFADFSTHASSPNTDGVPASSYLSDLPLSRGPPTIAN